MIPTRDIYVFIRENDAEFRELVARQCEFLCYPGSPDDVVQDLYLRFLTVVDVIALFDENRGMMSTYMFKVIHNFIVGCYKGHECSFYRYQIVLVNKNSTDDNINNFEKMIDYYKYSDDYESMAYCNNASNRENSLTDDIKDFEKDLSNHNIDMKFPLRKRDRRVIMGGNVKTLDSFKDEKISEEELEQIQEMMINVEEFGCSLYDIFQLLYRGYTNAQISEVYGISSTTVSMMKTKLAKVILKYGIKV